MKTKMIRAASAEIICSNKLRSCSTVRSKIIMPVPQVLLLLLSTAEPLMPRALTILVKRAVPAQISITSKSCESMPEGMTLWPSLVCKLQKNWKKKNCVQLHWGLHQTLLNCHIESNLLSYMQLAPRTVKPLVSKLCTTPHYVQTYGSWHKHEIHVCSFVLQPGLKSHLHTLS